MYYMTRTFDHAGYYETRLVLAIVAIAVASWFLRTRHDRSYWIMLASGALFQGAMEWGLGLSGMRGPDFSLTVFGLQLRSRSKKTTRSSTEKPFIHLELDIED